MSVNIGKKCALCRVVEQKDGLNNPSTKNVSFAFFCDACRAWNHGRTKTYSPYFVDKLNQQIHNHYMELKLK